MFRGSGAELGIDVRLPQPRREQAAPSDDRSVAIAGGTAENSPTTNQLIDRCRSATSTPWMPTTTHPHYDASLPSPADFDSQYHQLLDQEFTGYIQQRLPR